MLIAMMTCALCPLTVSATAAAPEQTNALVWQQALELEEAYGIDIQYPADLEGNALITQSNLDTLNMALATITPQAVREVSDYYRRKNGRPITFSYVLSDRNYSANSIVVLAGFDNTTSLIELYIPSSRASAIASGDAPINIIHEFGHAIHLMYTDRYGFDRMKQEWLTYNNGIGYDPIYIMENPNDKVFVSGYAATSFAEDVAEVIGHTFIRNQTGQGFANKMVSGGQNTGLGNKVVYVENMLAACLQNSSGALQNYRKAYTASSTLNYQGMNYSGEYLQYAGYPQPRYVLGGTLRVLNKQRDTAYWLQDLGGWYVQETSGKEIIVFPGGVWSDVSRSFVAPVKAAA